MRLADQNAFVNPSAGGDAFRCGAVDVRPSVREIGGPGGIATLEPRVLQVLLALAGCVGHVVSREALLAQCWPGMVVGEDSLNRAIASLRKALRAVGGGLSVETITKSGYRLCVDEAPTAAALDAPGSDESSGRAPAGWRPSRRQWLVAGAASTAALAAATAWWHGPDATRRRARSLVEQAARQMRDDRWGGVDPLALLQEAIRLAPEDARAWGLLALGRRDLALSPREGLRELQAIADCQMAVREALLRDPDQPDAQVALATLEPPFTRWLAAERQLLALRERFPDHESVLAALSELYGETGRAHARCDLCRRLLALEPTSPVYAGNLVVALWRAGEYAEMDRAGEEARRDWPGNEYVWAVRMETLGYTGRAAEALAMIERHAGPGEHPPGVGDALVAAFRAWAGKGRREDAVAAALAASTRRQSSALNVMPILAKLGAIADALALAEACFLARGARMFPYRYGASEPSVTEMRHRETAPLFYPTSQALWAEPRFAALCGDIGLVDYWRASGSRPDLAGDLVMPA